MKQRVCRSCSRANQSRQKVGMNLMIWDSPKFLYSLQQWQRRTKLVRLCRNLTTHEEIAHENRYSNPKLREILCDPVSRARKPEGVYDIAVDTLPPAENIHIQVNGPIYTRDTHKMGVTLRCLRSLASVIEVTGLAHSEIFAQRIRPNPFSHSLRPGPESNFSPPLSPSRSVLRYLELKRIPISSSSASFDHPAHLPVLSSQNRNPASGGTTEITSSANLATSLLQRIDMLRIGPRGRPLPWSSRRRFCFTVRWDASGRERGVRGQVAASCYGSMFFLHKPEHFRLHRREFGAWR